MPNKQNITSENEYFGNEEEHYQNTSINLYYREKLQGFYKDCEIKDIQDWLDNSVGIDGAPYN